MLWRSHKTEVSAECKSMKVVCPSSPHINCYSTRSWLDVKEQCCCPLILSLFFSSLWTKKVWAIGSSSRKNSASLHSLFPLPWMIGCSSISQWGTKISQLTLVSPRQKFHPCGWWSMDIWVCSRFIASQRFEGSSSRFGYNSNSALSFPCYFFPTSSEILQNWGCLINHLSLGHFPQ